MISKILLVGSAGYIGSNCPFECDKADIKSGKDFLKMVPRSYDTIIFLAAKLRSSKQDYLYNESLYNKLDEWLNIYPVTHVIYSSSAAVYGEGEKPHKENDYLEPINLYGKSKLLGEYHVREYLHHTVLRFGNVYGKLEGKPGHGVTELFKGGRQIIFGDGQQVRDFVPIDKIWEVIDSARKEVDLWQGVFNVSSFKPVTINDWYKIWGNGTPTYLEGRKNDIHTSWLDNAKTEFRTLLCK